jgi:site-specific DNA recombinase
VQENEVTVVSQAVSVLMSETKGEEISAFTRRGVEGVVLSGRSGGGLTYGYRKKRLYREDGEPIRGHLEIDAAQAEVVQRIFRDYASGSSPLAIAAALNAEGVPGPRGGRWNFTTIGGNAQRATGIIHNALYVGVRVWGRRTFVKDRETGARRGREAPGAPIRQDVPELRIVPDDLWQAVRDRHAQVSTGPMGGGLNGRKRPKRFLQGLIVCGLCGGPMTRAGPKEALRCATRAYRKACDNTAAPAIRGSSGGCSPRSARTCSRRPRSRWPCARCRPASQRRARTPAAAATRLSADLEEVKRRADRLVDQVAEGVLTGASVREKLEQLETRRAGLEAELAELAADRGQVVAVHTNTAGRWRQYIEALAAFLDAPAEAEDREAAAAVRALIHRIVFTPGQGRGEYALAIEGDLAPILELGQNEKGPLAGALGGSHVMRAMGAGTRVTRRHSPKVRFTQAA